MRCTHPNRGGEVAHRAALVGIHPASLIGVPRFPRFANGFSAGASKFAHDTSTTTGGASAGPDFFLCRTS